MFFLRSVRNYLDVFLAERHKCCNVKKRRTILYFHRVVCLVNHRAIIVKLLKLVKDCCFVPSWDLVVVVVASSMLSPYCSASMSTSSRTIASALSRTERDSPESWLSVELSSVGESALQESPRGKPRLFRGFDMGFLRIWRRGRDSKRLVTFKLPLLFDLSSEMGCEELQFVICNFCCIDWEYILFCVDFKSHINCGSVINWSTGFFWPGKERVSTRELKYR